MRRAAFWREASTRGVLLTLAGLFLLVCLVQSEYLIIPVCLEPVGRAAYRLAYLIVLPFRVLVMPFIPQENHHWPVAHTVTVSLGTPFFLWMLWRVWRRLLRRLSALGKRRAVSEHTPADALDELPHGAVATEKKAGPNRLVGSIGRREFLATSAAGAACMAVGGYGSFVEPARLQVRRYEIPIPDLCPNLDGLRIVHITDTHYGPFTSLAYLEDAIALANGLEGDLIALTGDYVHRSPRAIEPGIGIFAGLRSRFGTVAVLGNHEHWEGARACRAAFDRIGVPVLDNTHLYLTPWGFSPRPVPGRALCVAGTGDLWEGVISMDAALAGVSEATPRLLLSHNPDVAERIGGEYRVDLMLAGHTHGGQIRIPGFQLPKQVSSFGPKYLGGLCMGPCCPVIISRGVGLAGIPFRFRVPPELGVITLRPA